MPTNRQLLHMSIRADNATNLFTIADLKNVWVIANVYESNIGLVHLNDNVNVTTLAYPDKSFKGKVDKIMNVLDPVNKVMKVSIVLPNPGYLLKPEMFAKVELKDNGTHTAMAIPKVCCWNMSHPRTNCVMPLHCFRSSPTEKR